MGRLDALPRFHFSAVRGMLQGTEGQWVRLEDVEAALALSEDEAKKRRNVAFQLRCMAAKRRLVTSGLGYPDPLLLAAELLDPDGVA